MLFSFSFLYITLGWPARLAQLAPLHNELTLSMMLHRDTFFVWTQKKTMQSFEKKSVEIQNPASAARITLSWNPRSRLATR